MMPMDERTRKTADELVEILTRQHELNCALLQFASEKEAALLADDLGALRSTLESEEDTFQDCAALEKRRAAKTGELIALLGDVPDNLPLRGIAQRLGDPAAAKKLNDAGNRLAEVVVVLREKNLALNDILNVKNDYADVMLEILTGASSAPPRNYTGSGALDSGAEPGPGVVEIFA